jgi:hypothetical protein
MRRCLLTLACAISLAVPASAAAVSSIADRLSPAKTSIEVTSLPAGTEHVGLALMKNRRGDGLTYRSITVSESRRPYTPPVGYPVVDAQAWTGPRAGTGHAIGGWAGRLQTVPAGEESQAEKERREREAREKREREQREREEREHLEEPPHEEEPGSPGFEPGIDAETQPADFAGISTLHARLVRTEFQLNDPQLAQKIATVARLDAEHGAVLQPLVTFDGRTPSSSEAKALGAVAQADHTLIKRIEFGNETSFGYQYGDGYRDASYQARARAYAVDVKEAAEASRPYGVGVLCQAEDGGSGSATWVNEMFAAVPALSSYVAGWVIHPYDNATSVAAKDGYGVPKMVRMVANLAAHGDTTIPIDSTEDGVPSDNGVTLNNGVHMTYQEAGESLARQVTELRAAAKSHPLRSFTVYQVRDQRPHGAGTDHEWYFGALTNSGGAKSAYTTAVEQLLAQ